MRTYFNISPDTAMYTKKNQTNYEDFNMKTVTVNMIYTTAEVSVNNQTN